MTETGKLWLFKKGKSGNPGGRPKGDPEVKEILKAAAPAAARKLTELINSQSDKIALNNPRFPQPEIHKIMDENRFSVIVAHRKLGKTVCTINQLIKKALLDKSGNGRYGYIAPYRNQAKSIAWDYLKYFSSAIPDYKVNEGELAVDFFNGARIRLFGADNADAMRGLYFDGVILDEVADMRLEVWGEIVRPALSDRHGWACFIGTPKGMNLFYDLAGRNLNAIQAFNPSPELLRVK